MFDVKTGCQQLLMSGGKFNMAAINATGNDYYQIKRTGTSSSDFIISPGVASGDWSSVTIKDYPVYTAPKCEFCDNDMELLATTHVCVKCKAVFKAMLAVFSEQS